MYFNMLQAIIEISICLQYRSRPLRNSALSHLPGIGLKGSDNTDDKDVQKQQNVLCLRLCFWQTMFPTSCIQGPAEIVMHRLVLNYI